MKWWLIAVLFISKGSGIGMIAFADQMLLGWSLFILGSLVLLWHHFAPGAQGLCDVVNSFVPDGRQVWLTIDDGPDCDDTPKILDLLDQFGAKATFFMIGERAERYPELVREVLARGHELGCHTFSHPLAYFWCARRAQVCRELDDNLAVLHAAGAKVRCFRSPAGIRNVFLRRCLKERHLDCIGWSLRSGDAIGGSLESVVQKVRAKVRPGSIILMHEGKTMSPSIRVEAFRRVLMDLRLQGFSCIVPTLK
ncbi:MAG: polysaccharide deacetylase family protein [Opitutales bacterium]|nr:polysaccharide deacetylase family protein [Opitutales bacterium]